MSEGATSPSSQDAGGPGHRSSRPGTVLMVGNSGVGKSVLFEHLTGGKGRSRASPGGNGQLREGELTEHRRGRLSSIFSKVVGAKPRPEDQIAVLPAESKPILVDAPGTAQLFGESASGDSTRALLFLGEVDTLLFVADAKNPRRSLSLFLQLAELRLPTVLVLNMADEAEQAGVRYDVEALNRLLDVEMCSTVAVDEVDSAKIVGLLSKARAPTTEVRYPDPVERAVEELSALLGGTGVPARALALMLLTGSPVLDHLLDAVVGTETARRARELANRFNESRRAPLDLAIAESSSRASENILRRATSEAPRTRAWAQRLGHYASHPVWGIPIALFALFIGYLWVGMLGAGVVVDVLDQQLFKGLILPAFDQLLADPVPVLVHDALLDENFGLLPTGLFLAIGIVLPVLFFFYTYFGALEESGYLARLSLLMDRSLRYLGLNGKGVLPLVFGMSCVTMAILSTRILKSRKERVIASFLLLLSFPCAPLLAVMMVVLSQLAWTAAVTVFGLLAVQTVAAGALVNRMMSERLPDFVLELPPLRIPNPRLVLRRAVRQTFGFLKEALPLFLLAAGLLFTLDRLGVLEVVQSVSKPVVNDFLGLPDEAVQVFIKTMIRRENGAAELTVVQGGFDSLQLVVTLFVMTVLVPCVNTSIVLVKEHGLKLAASMLAAVCVYSILAGAGLSWICRLTGVTFN
ncbi:MAG: ferrous iron transporter B [Deltaproteobacteria bacterium]|nr:ferrous iron transporter B [Deltaproteobacteria bacterium]